MPYGEGTEVGSSSMSSLNAMAIDIMNGQGNIEAISQENLTYGQKDVGMKSPFNRSRIKIYESGDLEMFSGDASGILVNKEFKTTNLYGQAVNVNAPLIRMNTEPNGLMWNDWCLNPKLYQISDNLNPRFFTGEHGRPLAGKKYMDDLKLSATARWWCPGSPNLCGAKDKHSGHWVRQSLSITPFYRAWEDAEYRKQLDELGIPV